MSDPLSHVASWIAPAAANLSITAADVDDPLIALIRERDRLYRLAEDSRERDATALEEQAGEVHDQICDIPPQARSTPFFGNSNSLVITAITRICSIRSSPGRSGSLDRVAALSSSSS
jgi:hypothetical protein